MVKDHFKVQIWVCVSDPFDEIKIAKAILEAVDGSSPNLSQLETLLQSIKKSVSGKRFILVLDDVWTEDDTLWKPLKITLIKNGAPGSRILVTTRNEKVAKKMGSTQTQLLDPLPDSCCWLILRQIAFHERNEVDRDMLKEIGWQIALKCKGMPLAAKALGSLLQFKNSLQEWENVLKSKVWEMDKVRTDIFPFLALSYNELHPTVKRCFSYCAIFPKDSDINVDDLIRIWMAQGFLYSTGTSGDMERKGREYFTDLAMRSFFQDFQRGRGVGVERIERCKMHDLVHDFAQFLTNNECLVAENIEVPVIKNVRHLHLLNFKAKATMDMFSHFQKEKICNLICEENEIPHNLFNNLKRVKLLKLGGCKLKEIPAEIGNLIHLRFLDLNYNYLLENLPRSICDLYNLQTLDLRTCFKLAGLPHEIHRLVNLKHLFVDRTSREFKFTQGFEKLVDLQSLDCFKCFRESGNKLGYLKDLNLIGGSLEICIDDMDDGCDNVVDAQNANLKNKAFIEHLTLDCRGRVGERVIVALQPSSNLASLNFLGFYLPNWITTLINLRELMIEEGGKEINIDAFHSLRKLPFLQHLTLYRLRMQHLRLGFFGLNTTRPPSAFPNLLTFRLMSCQWLMDWDDTGEENENTMISVLPRLQKLEIFCCWNLKALPHRLLRKAASSLQILKIEKCGYLRKRYDKEGECRDGISHIPIIDIN